MRLVMRRFRMFQALCPEPGGQLRVFSLPRQAGVMHKRPWSPERLVLDKKTVECVEALLQVSVLQDCGG